MVNKALDIIQSDSWSEDFLCREHGKLWMKVNSQPRGILVATLATLRDWQHTTYAIRPHTLNPSVSEIKEGNFLI